MIVQIYHLTRQEGSISNQPGQKSTSETNASSEKQGVEKKVKLSYNCQASVTILIVTIIYVLTSIFLVVMWLIVYRTYCNKDKIKIQETTLD